MQQPSQITVLLANDCSSWRKLYGCLLDINNDDDDDDDDYDDGSNNQTLVSLP